MFEKISFIKPDIPFDKNKFYAPMFRKKFVLSETLQSAKLNVCGLGYAYVWLNGKKVTEDLFTAPVSNYSKTLWYNTYDVTNLLNKGENILAVICGCGWYNEGIESAWDYDKAKWRDNPKFIMRLDVNGSTAVKSDSTWKCSIDSPATYNQLRCGEHFDSRLYAENWTEYNFDDSKWSAASEDNTPPKGAFRPCECEPIRECGVLPAKAMYKSGDDKYVFDIGQNISGYIRLHTNQTGGDKIIIRYAEEINEDYSLQLNDMEKYYPSSPFQTDEFICCGKDFVWSPIFVYHGFRYIEISGIKNPSLNDVSGVFVHQAVKTRTGFECSDERINKLFKAGQNATLSNLFYMPTDCPTREKLGWANDAQSSTEQMLINFETERVFEKWLTDIHDAMREDGALPGIIPTAGWGYHWGNGPVSDGVLFEIPYRLYLHTGNKKPLTDSIPYFKRYLDYLDTQEDKDGNLNFGLDDWAAPDNDDKVDSVFINALLKIKFIRILLLAQELDGMNTDEIKLKEQYAVRRVKEKYLTNGRCSVNKQTAAAMLIYFDIYDDFELLKKQLKELVEQKNFHHDCGMVGLRYLYRALSKCGLQEYAYKIITAEGFPSYINWLNNGATTLYERWNMTESKNHHMYSHFMAWLMTDIIGIQPDNTNGYRIDIKPYYVKELSYVRGYYSTEYGRITVEWKRENGAVNLCVEVPQNVNATYNGQKLRTGENKFIIKEQI